MSDDRRNVILVTIDSLRADHCGYVGDERGNGLTPTLDRMAEEGACFTNAVAPGPSTPESMPAVFTGELMTTYFSHEVGRSDFNTYELIDLNTRRPMIPDKFSEWGYATAAFTPNPYTGAHTNFRRAFDHYEDFREGGNGRLLSLIRNQPVLQEANHLVTWLRREGAIKPWTDYYDKIVEWIEDTEEPYFLWVFLLDVHTPYLVDREYRSMTWPEMYYYTFKLWRANATDNYDLGDRTRRKLHALYEDTIRFTDDFLQRLWEDVRETDPSLVVHADHGEAFGEHGTYGHEPYLYEENVHVPLVVYNASEQGTCDTPTSLNALSSMLRSIGRDEFSLEPYCDDMTPVVTKTSNGHRFAVRGQAWKYIAEVERLQSVGGTELYDLRTDPEERDDITGEYVDVERACERRIHSRLMHERELIDLHRASDEVRG